LSRPAVLAVVGAGPRAVGLLERLAANLAPGASRGLVVHVVDPFPPGAGRTWRRDQSPLLWMNSRAGDVTMFTDASVTCAGPVRPGPNLAEWAARARIDDPNLAAEARATTAESFPSRRLAGEYLSWSFHRATRDLDTAVHPSVAVGLSTMGGRQRVRLATGGSIEADVVVLAQGAIGGRSDGGRPDLVTFAERCGGAYLPPGYVDALDTAALPPGRDVVVAGLGLAFFDLMVLLTEGRGGRFAEAGHGRLRYHPSGAEPVLWVGSRTGLPYRPKPYPHTHGGACPLPRFVTADSLRAALASARPLAATWGIVCQELAWGYYHELWHAYPERTALPWAVFARRYTEMSWWDAEMAELLAAAVPDAADRLDPDVARTTLAERRFATEPELARWMRTHLTDGVRRASSARHSADAGAIRALVSIGDQLAELGPGGLAPAAGAALRRVGRFARVLGSGPPPARLAQLCALSEAGVVRFLGGGLTVAPDDERRAFLAHGSLAAPVAARYLVEARLPAHDLATGDPLLAGLVRAGDAVSTGPVGGTRLRVDGADYGILRPDGGSDPDRLALGAFASGGALGSFSRPGANAAFFRQNDATARRILSRLGV
jgi:uncharacterized NAD(P)/FAD-binding protein YdhS